jgi:hypothetical protein
VPPARGAQAPKRETGRCSRFCLPTTFGRTAKHRAMDNGQKERHRITLLYVIWAIWAAAWILIYFTLMTP